MLKHPNGPGSTGGQLALEPIFGLEGRIPRHELPDGELPRDVAYQLVHDELMLDGNARLNLATFVTTWMEPQADRLMAECLDKNMIDKDEYPQTAELERRCVHDARRPVARPGRRARPPAARRPARARRACSAAWRSSGAGSSAGEAAGQPADRPNLVMGINVQVCWEKFCQLLGRRAAPRADGRRPLPPRPPSEAVELCDENTIGVVAILGSTFDGSYEPVAGDLRGARRVAGADRARRAGPRRRCVRRASSPRSSTPTWSGTSGCRGCASINASGHKYGLVYPGVGWVALARRRRRCRRTWSSGSTTSAATCRPSRSTSPGPAPRSWRSTTTSSGSASSGYRRVQRLRARRGHPAVRPDRRARPVRAAHRGRRATGVRLHGCATT